MGYSRIGECLRHYLSQRICRRTLMRIGMETAIKRVASFYRIQQMSLIAFSVNRA